MPRYYCDYCDTYLTHDSPSVRKQHNAGYKHKANVREYYQQYEAQQNQYLIDQRIKAHLGQAASYQQVGAAFNQIRPRLPVLPTPLMPMPLPLPGNPQIPSPLVPGVRAIVMPRPGFVPAPGMPPMVPTPPGAPPLPAQVDGAPRPVMMNPPPIVPGSTPASTGVPPTYTPAMYQANPNPVVPSGGFDSSTMNTRPQASEVGQ